MRTLCTAIAAVLASLLAAALVPGSAGPAQAAQVTYTPSTATFANPERGLFRQPNCDVPLNQTDLLRWRTTQNVALVRCVFYLSDFKTSLLSLEKLAFLEQQANAVEATGLKLIVRFTYTESTAGDDASLTWVLQHIDQLKPFFHSNAHVIDVVESGFVGTWGEGAFSQNFGTTPNVTTAQWADRKAVVTRLLSAVPSTLMVLLRTPGMKRTMYDFAPPVSSTTAYNSSALSRLGHHNDCFLASSDDMDTYTDIPEEYPYLRAETTYLAMGGETCAPNPPRSGCPTARQELAMFHYSYLNRDFKPEVWAGWVDGGCKTEIEQRLGYRFGLVASQFPASVRRGSSFLARIGLKNTGYATPHNSRPVYLVLRTASPKTIVRVKLATDPRRWTPGANILLSQTITVPSTMPIGTYELLLSLPDPAPSLAKPQYAIRMANEAGVWEAASGMNKLLAGINVTL
jgi:hypothetical protein